MFRLLLLRQWIFHRHKVRFSEMLRRLSREAFTERAKKKIEFCSKEGEYLCVSLRNVGTLYWPVQVEVRHLYQVVAETLYPDDWHYYEDEHTQVTSADIVADCGAAEGLFSLTVVKKCRHVYVIEPLPLFVSSLRATFAKIENVHIIAAAISDVTGTAMLSDRGIGSSIGETVPTGTGISVQKTTLDDLFWKHQIPVTYIKADLEGCELDMLKGARNTIGTYLPKIAITTYHRQDHASQISDFIRSIDARYRIKTKGIEQTWGVPVMLHAWVE